VTHIPDAALRRVRDQIADGMRPPLPRLINARYEPRELLGRGGMGEVHRAADRLLGRDVALKVLAAAGEGASGERLRREARVLAKLEHPGIVPVHDAGALEDGRAYYVMRLVEGSRLDEVARTAGRGELLRVMLRITDAVAFAHERGIIHRDLKPGNVMVGPFGEVLVLDWGVAKSLAGREVAVRVAGPRGSDQPLDAAEPITTSITAPITAHGTVVGTPGYMAPEQARGDGQVDHRADIHALGVMLRELLAVPAHGAVPRPLASIVSRATAPRADARYASVVEFAEDIRRWLDGGRVHAHRESTLERGGRFVRRHQAAILLLLAYALIRGWILVWRGI
jgi:serine/threonine protein kinase